MPAGRRSATPTGTAGSCRSSRSDFPAEAALIDVAGRAQLLLETALAHGKYEAVAPPHDWWDWYAAYMDARVQGNDPDAATAAAGRYMADAKGIVVHA